MGVLHFSALLSSTHHLFHFRPAHAGRDGVACLYVGVSWASLSVPSVTRLSYPSLVAPVTDLSSSPFQALVQKFVSRIRARTKNLRLFAGDFPVCMFFCLDPYILQLHLRHLTKEHKENDGRNVAHNTLCPECRTAIHTLNIHGKMPAVNRHFHNCVKASFVPKCLDRVKPCRAPRRIVAKHNSNPC